MIEADAVEQHIVVPRYDGRTDHAHLSICGFEDGAAEQHVDVLAVTRERQRKPLIAHVTAVVAGVLPDCTHRWTPGGDAGVVADHWSIASEPDIFVEIVAGQVVADVPDDL